MTEPETPSDFTHPCQEFQSQIWRKDRCKRCFFSNEAHALYHANPLSSFLPIPPKQTPSSSPSSSSVPPSLTMDSERSSSRPIALPSNGHSSSTLSTSPKDKDHLPSTSPKVRIEIPASYSSAPSTSSSSSSSSSTSSSSARDHPAPQPPERLKTATPRTRVSSPPTTRFHIPEEQSASTPALATSSSTPPLATASSGPGSLRSTSSHPLDGAKTPKTSAPSSLVVGFVNPEDTSKGDAKQTPTPSVVVAAGTEKTPEAQKKQIIEQKLAEWLGSSSQPSGASLTSSSPVPVTGSEGNISSSSASSSASSSSAASFHPVSTTQSGPPVVPKINPAKKNLFSRLLGRDSKASGAHSLDSPLNTPHSTPSSGGISHSQSSFSLSSISSSQGGVPSMDLSSLSSYQAESAVPSGMLTRRRSFRLPNAPTLASNSSTAGGSSKSNAIASAVTANEADIDAITSLDHTAFSLLLSSVKANGFCAEPTPRYGVAEETIVAWLKVSVFNFTVQDKLHPDIAENPPIALSFRIVDEHLGLSFSLPSTVLLAAPLGTGDAVFPAQWLIPLTQNSLDIISPPSLRAASMTSLSMGAPSSSNLLNVIPGTSSGSHPSGMIGSGPSTPIIVGPINIAGIPTQGTSASASANPPPTPSSTSSSAGVKTASGDGSGIQIDILNVKSRTEIGSCVLYHDHCRYTHPSINFGSVQTVSWDPINSCKGQMKIGLKLMKQQKTQEIEEEWDALNAGGSLDHSTWDQSPQYLLEIPHDQYRPPNNVRFVLRSNVGSEHPIGFYILKLVEGRQSMDRISSDHSTAIPSSSSFNSLSQARRLTEQDLSQSVDSFTSTFRKQTMVSCELSLLAGTYILIVCCQKPSIEGAFQLFMVRDHHCSFELVRLFSDEEKHAAQTPIASGQKRAVAPTDRPSSSAGSVATNVEDDFDFGEDDCSASFGSKPFTLSFAKKSDDDEGFDDLDWDKEDDDAVSSKKKTNEKTSSDPKKTKKKEEEDDDFGFDFDEDEDDEDAQDNSVIHQNPSSSSESKKNDSEVDCFDDDFDFDSDSTSKLKSLEPKSTSDDVVPAMRLTSHTFNCDDDDDDDGFHSDFAEDDEGDAESQSNGRSSLVLKPQANEDDGILQSIQDGDRERFSALWEDVSASNKVSNALNKTDGDQRTYTWWAAYCDQTEILETLLKAGANPHKADRFGVTPILAAASCGHINTGRLLLQFGASPYDHDNQQESVLYKSSKHGHLDFVRMVANSSPLSSFESPSSSSGSPPKASERVFDSVSLPSVINEAPQWNCTAMYLVESSGFESMAANGLDVLEITNRNSADNKCYSQLQLISLDGVIVSANVIISEPSDGLRQSGGREQTGTVKKDVDYFINKLIASEKTKDNRDSTHLIALCYAEITSQLAASGVIPPEWAVDHAPELSLIRLSTREFESLFYSVDRNNIAFKTSCQKPMQLNVALLDPSLLLLSYRLDRISHVRVLRIDYSATSPAGLSQIGSEATSLWSLKQQKSHHTLLHHYRLIGVLPLYRNLHDLLTKTGYGRLSVLVRKVRNLSKEVKHYHFSLAISNDQRRTFWKKKSNTVWNIKYNFILPSKDMALNIVLFTKDKQHGEKAVGHALVAIKDLEVDSTVARWYRLFADKGIIAEVLLDLFLEPS